MSYILKLKEQRLHQESNKAEYQLASILRGKGKSEIDNPLPYEDLFVATVSTNFKTRFALHLQHLIETGMLDNAFALSYDPTIPPEFMEQQMGEISRMLAEPFGIEWAQTMEPEIRDTIESMYGAGIIMAQRMVGVTNPDAFQFNLIDQRAIDQLNNMGVIYTSTAAGPQIITPVATRLAKQALEMGLSTKDAGKLFKEGLASTIPLRSDIYYNNLASIVINRARNFSRILAFDRLGVTYGEVLAIGDDRTCPRCLLMNGTVFRISDLVGVIERVIASTTPSDLINANPFINGLDTETNEFMLSNGSRISTAATSTQMASAGLLPSYHGECRCSIITYVV